MDIIVVIQQVIILAVLMAVGYAGGKTKVLGEHENKAMTVLLTHISLPALILSSFSVGYSRESLRAIVLVFVLSFFAHILAILVGKVAFFRYPLAKKQVLRFGNAFANSGFMGIPFIHALFGEQALLYGSIYMLPFHIILWTYGEAIFEEGSSKYKIEKLIKNPTIITILVGLVLFGLNIRLPYVIKKPIDILAPMTLPLAMLILGQRMTRIRWRLLLKDKDSYYGCFIKLVVIPLITFLALRFLPIDPIIRNVVVTMQALPIAVLTVVLSQKHGGDVDFASEVTVLSHLLCILTLPLIALLF